MKRTIEEIAKDRGLKMLNEEMQFVEKLRSCVYKGDEITIYNHTKLGDRYVIVETDSVFKEEKEKGEHMFKTVDLVNNTSSTNVNHTFDMQVLQTLAHKHDGINSQFPAYASRMLNMEK